MISLRTSSHEYIPASKAGNVCVRVELHAFGVDSETRHVDDNELQMPFSDPGLSQELYKTYTRTQVAP